MRAWGIDVVKMSRGRALELADQPFTSTYTGPLKSGLLYCTPGAPLNLEDCGYLTDTSEWTCEPIEIEPEWVIKQHAENHLFSGQWYAGPKRLFTGHETPTWKTESRAETFLELLKEEWWDE